MKTKTTEIKTEIEEHRGRRYKVLVDTDGKRYRVGKSTPLYVTRSSDAFILEWLKKNPNRQRAQTESRDAVKLQLEKKFPPEEYPAFFSNEDGYVTNLQKDYEE